MKICYTSDLHGRAVLYDQLEALLRVETPDLLILGGDLFIDGEPDDPLGTQIAQLERSFLPRLRTWQELLPGMRIACLAGNHELRCAQQRLHHEHDAGRLLLLDHQQVWSYRGFALLGYGTTPATPHWAKDFERLDLPDDPLPPFEGLAWDDATRTLRAVSCAEHFGRLPSMAEELAAAPRVTEPLIFVAHAPPYDTKLDRLATIPRPIGSRAVRQFIEERQPVCALHGHVHESPAVTGQYVDRIGATVCVNPGQTHEILHAVVFEAQRPAETLRHTVLK